MPSILIMYWHGLGDLLCLTPQLRHLKKHSFEVDLLVRPQVLSSHLLDHCPYVRNVIPLPFKGGGPAEGGFSGRRKGEACKKLFHMLAPQYTNFAKITNFPQSMRRLGGKIERNNKVLFSGKREEVVRGKPEVGISEIDAPKNLDLEVFISRNIERETKRYIAKKYPNGFIFKHTTPEFHPAHNWNSKTWIARNLGSNLPIFEASSSPWEDINAAFVMAREATHRVLSSSVFVHACDAMNTTMDVVYYGKPSPHSLPLDGTKIKELELNYHDT